MSIVQCPAFEEEEEEEEEEETTMQCAVSRCQVTKRMRLDRGEIDVWARPSRAVPGLPGVLAAAAVLYSTV